MISNQMRGTRPQMIVYTESIGSGLGREVSDTAGALQKLGASVHYIAPDQDYEPMVSARTVLPMSRRKFGLRKLFTMLSVSVIGALKIFFHAKRKTPVVIVCFGPQVPVSLAPLLAAKLRGARTIYRLDDIYQHTGRYPSPLQGMERWFYRLAYRNCDAIGVMNQLLVSRLVQQIGIRRSRIFHMKHGTLTYDGIARGTATAEESTLLVFGSLRPNKNVAESIQAFQFLRRNGVKVRLRIVGVARREDAKYWQACESLIAAAPEGIDLRVGFVPEEEMPSVLSGVDAFLCPYTGFGSESGVTNMALSNGLPVIATRESIPAMASDLGAAWTRVSDTSTSEEIAAAIQDFYTLPVAARLEAAESASRRLFPITGWIEAAQSILGVLREEQSAIGATVGGAR